MAREQPDEVGLAQRQRQAAVILAIAGEHVEGTELRLLAALARAECGEVGDAVGAEHDRLAVDHQLLLAKLQRGLDNQRKVPRQIATAPC